jgi:hypothetical protein
MPSTGKIADEADRLAGNRIRHLDCLRRLLAP